MRRIVTTIGGCLAVLLVFVSLTRWPEFVTKYAPHFSERGLASLKIGASFVAVTNAIGLPLSFTVIAQPDATNGYAPLYMRQFDRIPAFAERKDALLLLRYSEPKIGDDYYAIELILRDAKLLEVRRFIPED